MVLALTGKYRELACPARKVASRAGAILSKAIKATSKYRLLTVDLVAVSTHV